MDSIEGIVADATVDNDFIVVGGTKVEDTQHNEIIACSYCTAESNRKSGKYEDDRSIDDVRCCCYEKGTALTKKRISWM